MNDEFTRDEKKLLKARTPRDYIDKSLKFDISPGRKAFVTRHWLNTSKFTIDDIKYARNRHPYWKAKKMEGTAERNALRTQQHNYNIGGNIIWDEELIKDFITSNKKDKKGNYINKDWELARDFECTIPAIQHMRRKFNMAIKLLASSREKITTKKLVNLLLMGEGQLRRLCKKKQKKS